MFKEMKLKVPSLQMAEELMAEAGQLNPGPWISHSVFVAKAAKEIASHHPRLDPSLAYVLGYLHDIGRREGVTDMRHVLDGYRYLERLGYEDAAQICMTHSFPIKEVNAGAGKWDCTAEEYEFAKSYLGRVEYTEYDELIQLCDAISLPGGFCIIEKRLVDVALRHGFNTHTLPKWRAYLAIQRRFEQEIGRSIYHLLPGVVENTFGLSLV
jgi:putative nucleotidyltransferase with HDIG domain